MCPRILHSPRSSIAPNHLVLPWIAQGLFRNLHLQCLPWLLLLGFTFDFIAR